MKSVDFFFPAGETTFLVGKSGSGKSTVTNLLLRYYQPSSGTLTIDGVPVQETSVSWLRDNITLVQQQSNLFNESIFRNIAFGRRRHEVVTEADILRAAEISFLQQVIADLPDGIDTIVGHGGSTLSGGQRQRVALARARLRDTPVLILDEATSALDQTSRVLVMDAIRSWRQGKTTIVITHDVSQVKDNDYVYLFGHAEVVEEGYRRNLVAQEGSIFRSFVSAQDSDQEGPRDEEQEEYHRRGSDATVSTLASDDSLPFEPAKPTYLSRFLGLDEEPAIRRSTSHRLSLGVGTTYANSMITDGLWKSPGMTPKMTPKATPKPTWKGWASTLSPSDNDAADDTAFGKSTPQVDTPEPATSGTFGAPTVNRRFSWVAFDYGNSADVAIPAAYTPKRYSATFSGEPAHEGANYQYSPRHSSIYQGLDMDELPGRDVDDPSDDFAPEALSQTFTTGQHSQAPLAEHPPPQPQRRRQVASIAQILGTVWPSLSRKYRIKLAVAFACAVGSAVATPAFSFVLSKLLTSYSLTTGRSAAARDYSLAVLGLAIFNGIMLFTMQYFLETCGQAWVDSLRKEALKRILAQPKSWFDKEKNNASRITECLDRNAEEMRNLVGRFAGYVVSALVMVTVSITWALVACWQLTLVGLATMPAVYLCTRVFDFISAKWERKGNNAATSVASIFTETFTSLRVVRAYVLENYFKQKHAKAYNEALLIGIKRASWTGVFFGLTDSISLFVTALIFWYAATILRQGGWALGDVLQSTSLLLFGIGNANNIVAFVPQINSSRVTATYMLYLANLPMNSSHEDHGQVILETPLPIRFDRVSFTYPSRPDAQVLKDVSIDFEAGSCTAIVGSSGSGKSTIANLLLALYPPQSPTKGTSTGLTFAGVSVLDCSISSLRSQTAIVSQTPILFPATIEENIRYGLSPSSPLSNQSNIEAAATEAGIHEFITSLPHGYSTVVGEGGQGLSGGQAQRISIARALVRRPRILILDEATSALDPESSEQICETISKLVRRAPSKNKRYSHLVKDEGMGEMAVVIITHNVDMMRVAETIVVLDKGTVVEVGGFQELIRRRGNFAALVASEMPANAKAKGVELGVARAVTLGKPGGHRRMVSKVEEGEEY